MFLAGKPGVTAGEAIQNVGDMAAKEKRGIGEPQSKWGDYLKGRETK